jgi:hypothetical protein
MEGTIRKPFQGITNIIRFNWHFYVLAAAFISLVLQATLYVPEPAVTLLSLSVLLIVLSIVLSLAVSFYVYDHSHLYTLDWLSSLSLPAGALLVNIHAGFDETSALLVYKYPAGHLQVLDFYDPVRHTEVSIKRARKAYPAYPGTKTITTSDSLLQKESVDCIFTILSAHEIRNREERVVFFKGLEKSLKEEGKIVVVEHLRDWPNFIAYNIGFLHFFSKKEWQYTFDAAGLNIVKEAGITPFISAFILQRNGTTS